MRTLALIVPCERSPLTFPLTAVAESTASGIDHAGPCAGSAIGIIVPATAFLSDSVT
jgi:hypothetical protein